MNFAPAASPSPSPTAAWAAAIKSLADHQLEGKTLASALDDLAACHGYKVALTCEHETLTYVALLARRNAYARWALSVGVGQGDVVGLMMQNCSDYVAIWLGITYVGGVVALLNTNLTGCALLHGIEAADVKHLIVDGECHAAIRQLGANLSAEMRVWQRVDTSAHRGAANALDHTEFSGEVLASHERRVVDLQSVALLIYTSGTTGLPKAALITQARIVEWGAWFAGMMVMSSSDRLYDCLPMYHSTGGVLGISAALLAGGAVVVRRRFSVSRIWMDVVRENCTILLYVGELCRLLADAPAQDAGRRHQLRLFCGNGLSRDVWRRLADRFGPVNILEFYASTEGNISLYNCEGRPGSIGRVPAFLRHRFPIELIACDPLTGEATRDGSGHVQRCGVNEAGEAIGRIAGGAKAHPGMFDGYTDREATQRKILRNVFAEGDAWFRTGDLMRRDREGYYYFIDRLGDTFRWRGENVSTTEVGEVLGRCPGVVCAVVYGVSVPNADGKACMAAMMVAGDFSLPELYICMSAELPAYARPVFLRICDAIETTGTFKPIKTRLTAESYNLDIVTDPIYVVDRDAGSFRRFDTAGMAELVNARLRL